MTQERTQGLMFIALAAVALLYSSYLMPLTQNGEFIIIALLITVFGVPHGALDPLFAKTLLQLKTNLAWALFLFLYLLLGLLVIVFWWLSPLFFLVFFLLCSIFHFSGDLAQGTAFLTRLLYGGACIVLPAALHHAELGALFSLLVGSDNGVCLADVLHVLAWPWLTALGLALLHLFPRNWLSALEIVAASALALVLSPLLGFTIFFCAMHSARHIIRSKKYAGISFSALAKVSVLPMFSLIIMVTFGWFFLPQSPLDERIIQFVFVGLAALTVPHMALVERIRFKGW
jgi:Brp/Blh family beta-carotene 15,15'-monooxygenase